MSYTIRNDKGFIKAEISNTIAQEIIEHVKGEFRLENYQLISRNGEQTLFRTVYYIKSCSSITLSGDFKFFILIDDVMVPN
jgi:hypothetical protein